MLTTDQIVPRPHRVYRTLGCCGGREGHIIVVGECPHCEAEVDADGEAVDQCSYSREECPHCLSRPCDQSC